MTTVMDVQASFGFCCFCAAVVTAVASVEEAKAAVTDVTASGSSYSFCAAAATTTVSDASDLYKIKVSGKKGRDSCLFCVWKSDQSIRSIRSRDRYRSSTG